MAVAEAVRPIFSLSMRNTGIEEPEPYTSKDFAAFVADYPDLRTELTREGELMILPPTKTKTGILNSKINMRLGIWAEETNSGEVIDSSTIITLPNGAKRSPDAAWIEKSRWQALTEDDQENFAPICPDFVIELRSRSDRLSAVQKKMREYIENGAKLGWLIDPKIQRVEVYRPGHEVEIINNPTSVSGEPELPGFTLNLNGILE